MIDLVTLYTELDPMIDSLLTSLPNERGAEKGKTCEDLCVHYRTSGIAALLLELDIDRFYHMLIRSGLTRLFLLKTMSQEEQEGSRYTKLTRANGFFDSVAANQLNVAEKIVFLSPRNWNKKFEYEDDYCYILFLHQMVKGGENNQRREILTRFEKVLDGEPSQKLDICYALLERDSGKFDDCFHDLLGFWTEEIEYQMRSISRNEIEFTAAKHVYIEGLALLHLAEMTGIETREEYEYCPKEARMPMSAPFPDNGYPK